MKTREIRERIKSMGFEQGVVYCLEAINETQQQNARDLKELATYFEKLVGSMDSMLVVAGNMKQVIQRSEPAEEDLGPNTQALDREQPN
jgi:hypothetical protein